MYFRGYIETNGKQSIEKIAGRSAFKTLEEVQDCNSYAGVLAQDTILIDVDDYEQSEILLSIVEARGVRCRAYRTTRGKHFLFRNNGVQKNGNGCRLAVGLDADVKLGTKNSYEVLRFKGEDREAIYDTVEDGDEPDRLPRWMMPISKKRRGGLPEHGGGGWTQPGDVQLHPPTPTGRIDGR